jgi:Cu+-exporting ATPase
LTTLISTAAMMADVCQMMPVVEAPVRKKEKPVQTSVPCYHCGETCDTTISEDEHSFCCDGCKFVYGLLKDNGLCNYYDLSQTPGIKVKGKYNSEKFLFLEILR